MDKFDDLRQNIQNNMYFLVVLIMCIVYIFYGLLTIEATGKSVLEILRDGAINFIFGWLIGKMLSMQGYGDGSRLPVLEKAKETHANRLAMANEYVDRIEDFVEYKNAEDLKRYQMAILSTEGLKYDAFTKGEYSDYRNLKKETFSLTYKGKRKYNKHQWRVIHLAYHPKIKKLIAGEILSGETVSFKGENDLGETKEQNSKKGDTKAFGSRMMFALFFGYFGVSMMAGFNWANLIWTAIQAITFLSSGMMRYYNAYTFMKDKMVLRYEKQTNKLVEFEQWNKNHPRPIITTEIKGETESGNN